MIGLFRKNKVLFSGFAFLILLCGFLILHEVQGGIARQPLSVMTYNIGTIDGDSIPFSRVVEVISRDGVPDLLILQEVREKEEIGGRP